MTRNSLPLKDRIEIYEYLKGVLEPGEAEGTVVFKEGGPQTDAQVLSLLDPTAERFTEANVAGVRREMFGKLVIRPPKPADAEAVAALTQRIDMLELKMANLHGVVELLRRVVHGPAQRPE